MTIDDTLTAITPDLANRAQTTATWAEVASGYTIEPGDQSVVREALARAHPETSGYTGETWAKIFARVQASVRAFAALEDYALER